jgi:hypothetical protein
METDCLEFEINWEVRSTSSDSMVSMVSRYPEKAQIIKGTSATVAVTKIARFQIRRKSKWCLYGPAETSL